MRPYTTNLLSIRFEHALAAIKGFLPVRDGAVDITVFLKQLRVMGSVICQVLAIVQAFKYLQTCFKMGIARFIAFVRVFDFTCNDMRVGCYNAIYCGREQRERLLRVFFWLRLSHHVLATMPPGGRARSLLTVHLAVLLAA